MSEHELKFFRALVCANLSEPLRIDDGGDPKKAIGYYQNFSALAESEERARQLIEMRIEGAEVDWRRSEIRQETAETDEFSKPEAFPGRRRRLLLMKRLHWFTIGLSLCAALASCERQMDFQPDVQKISVENVEHCDFLSQAGQYVAQPQWHALDQREAKKLADWLKGTSGWKDCHETFAPQTVFRSSSFNLNVMANWAVLNYSLNGSRWRQVCTNLAPEDIRLLASIAP
jgi:hypothetical protein